MDRINKAPFAFLNARRIIIALVLVTVITIMAYKVIDRGWLEPHTAGTELVMTGTPTILFFNSYLGCECARKVYIAADTQMAYWSEEDRMGVPVITVDLDRRYNMRKQYEVVRAPTLILLDAEENEIFRQSDVVTDDYPLDLETFERKIQELMRED
jgi:hypothetical protein